MDKSVSKMRPLDTTFIYKFLIIVLYMVSFYENHVGDTQLYGPYSPGERSSYYMIYGKKKIGWSDGFEIFDLKLSRHLRNVRKNFLTRKGSQMF